MDSKKAALILIDLQKDVVSLHSSGPEVVKKAAKVVEAARKLGIRIIFVNIEFRADHTDVVDTLTDAILAGTAPHPAERNLVLQGTEGAALAEGLTALPEDIVIVRKRTGGFYGTPLEIYLHTMAIDTLLIGGIATNWGVEMTVREATQRGFNIIVLSDCCTTSSPEAHDYAIRNIFPRLARVMSSAQVLAELQKSS